ncbi:MAG TPA: flippase [Methanomassiliicoccales archaeon]|jgi:O-antigen/teichoic acid export membrane protein
MIGRRSLLIVLSTIIASILSFVGLLAMTNYLGKDAYGTIAWVLATIGTLNTVSDLGFNSAHIKRVSEGQDENDCVSTYLAIKVSLTSFMVVFVFAALLVWNQINSTTISAETWNLVILFVLYYVMYDMATVVTSTYNARMETTKSQAIALTDPLVRVPLIIFVSINHMTTIDLAFAYVIAALAVLLVSVFLLRRGSIKWKRPTLFRSYLKFALPISLISIAGAVTSNLDKILIGYFDMPGNVAYYSSSQQILAVVGVIGSAVATVSFPSFSLLHSKGDIATIRKQTYAAERYIAMIGLPIVTLVVLFPTEICLAVFGKDFAPAGDAMRFLGITLSLTMLNQVYTSQIMGVNRPDISAKIILGTFCLNVVLLLIFIPKELFGVKMLGLSYTGAAIATATTALALFVSVRIIVKRLTGTGTERRMIKHLIAAAVAGAAIVLLNAEYRLSGLIALAIFFVVTALVFLGTLIALKEFTKYDLRQILDIINPAKMVSYMGEEIKNKR